MARSEAAKQIRRDRAANSVKKLDELDIDYRVRNNGHHYIVMGQGSDEYDFWPAGGRWIKRGDKKRHGTGLDSLLLEINLR